MAGAAIAYVPFLTVLLPVRITDMAGASDVQWLAYVTFAGAIAASLGNILFGWLSDIPEIGVCGFWRDWFCPICCL